MKSKNNFICFSMLFLAFFLLNIPLKAQLIDVSEVNLRLNEKLNNSSVGYRYKNLFGFYTNQTGVVVLGQGVEGQEFPTWDTLSQAKLAEVISSTFLAQDISAIKGIDKKRPFTLIIFNDGNTMIRHSSLEILDNSKSIYSLKKSDVNYFLVNGIYSVQGDSVSRIAELKRNIMDDLLNTRMTNYVVLHFELIPELGCLVSIECNDMEIGLETLMNGLMDRILPFLVEGEKIIFHLINQEYQFEHLIVHDLEKGKSYNFQLSN